MNAPRRCAYCGSKKSPHLVGLDRLGIRMYACRECDPKPTPEEEWAAMVRCSEIIADALKLTEKP